MVSGGIGILRSVIAKVIKAVIRKTGVIATSPGGAGALTGVAAYDIINDLFLPGGEFESTDNQTADGLKKSTMALIQDMEMGGIPLDGLRGRDGQPLPTNYIVIDIEKERIFPIFKYRSAAVVRAARRRGSSRGFGRAQRSFSQRKYLYS